MDGAKLRALRKVHGMTQDDLGRRLGMSREHISRLEKGIHPISPAVAAAARSIKSPPLDRRSKLTDPMERIIEDALIEAGIDFLTEAEMPQGHRLDFHLPDLDIAIEVKRFYSHRSGNQLSRHRDVIMLQGERAVRMFAALVKSGCLADAVADMKAAS